MTASAALERALNILRHAATGVFRRLATTSCALFVFFFAFYFNTGEKLYDTPVYDRGDVFFRADTRRAWRDMVGDRTSSHVHTSGHPNFVIFHQPVGYGLTVGIKKVFGGKKLRASKMASILMTASAAAGTVTLFYLLLLANGIPVVRGVLFSCVLGFSTVQVFYGAVPETYVFSALGLTAVAFLACRRDLGEPWWQLAAVYAWSALTTNIVLIGIWALVRHWQRPLLACVRKVAVSIAITIALVVALNVVQRLIYPGTVLFFHSQSVAKESSWLYWENLQEPLKHARILLQHQWISNIIAPEPVRTFPFGPDAPMASVEAGTWDMLRPAWPLFTVWCMVLVYAATSLFNRRFYTPAVLGALGVMVFNFFFFFVFGHDRMLYAALWTSISVFLVAAGCETLLQRKPAMSKPLMILLMVLIIGQAWHNWHFLGKIAALVMTKS